MLCSSGAVNVKENIRVWRPLTGCLRSLRRPATKQEVYQDVIDMVSLGRSDELVIDKIHAAEGVEL